MNQRLFLQERREKILQLLELSGRVSVLDLSERFALSAATIRNDLEALSKNGALIRTHGGAIPANRNGNLELSFKVRQQINARQKAHIGRVAAQMVSPGEAIILDASTTALAIAQQIKYCQELTVFTNSISVALELLDVPGITTLMPGGFVRPESISMVGADGGEFIKRFNFQKGFFGAKGLTLEEGLTDVNSDEVTTKRALVQQAKQTVAVVDSSKWGQVSFASFATIQQLGCIITDSDAPVEMITALQEAGVKVIIAADEGL